jgi:hypothetical protein
VPTSFAGVGSPIVSGPVRRASSRGEDLHGVALRAGNVERCQRAAGVASDRAQPEVEREDASERDERELEGETSHRDVWYHSDRTAAEELREAQRQRSKPQPRGASPASAGSSLSVGGSGCGSSGADRHVA